MIFVPSALQMGQSVAASYVNLLSVSRVMSYSHSPPDAGAPGPSTALGVGRGNTNLPAIGRQSRMIVARRWQRQWVHRALPVRPHQRRRAHVVGRRLAVDERTLVREGEGVHVFEQRDWRGSEPGRRRIERRDDQLAIIQLGQMAGRDVAWQDRATGADAANLFCVKRDGLQGALIRGPVLRPEKGGG